MDTGMTFYKSLRTPVCAGLAGLLAGVTAAAAAPLVIRDTIGREWVNEPITWELPGVSATRVLVQRDGGAIPAQVVPATNGVTVLFVVDKLAPDCASTVTADFNQTGPATTDLRQIGRAHV